MQIEINIKVSNNSYGDKEIASRRNIEVNVPDLPADVDTLDRENKVKSFKDSLIQFLEDSVSDNLTLAVNEYTVKINSAGNPLEE